MKHLHTVRSCFKFMKFGSKSNKGCNKGSTCQYFHPILCKFSVRSKKCFNKDCTYPHLPGTIREEGKDKHKAKHKGTNAKNSESARSRNASALNENEPDQPQPTELQNHFLELKKVVEAMSSRFQDQLMMIKSTLFHHQQQVFQQFPPASYLNPQNQMYPVPPHQFFTPHLSS